MEGGGRGRRCLPLLRRAMLQSGSEHSGLDACRITAFSSAIAEVLGPAITMMTVELNSSLSIQGATQSKQVGEEDAARRSALWRSTERKHTGPTDGKRRRMENAQTHSHPNHTNTIICHTSYPFSLPFSSSTHHLSQRHRFHRLRRVIARHHAFAFSAAAAGQLRQSVLPQG